MSQEIDLTRLPAPDVIETVSFEDIFARKKQRLIALMPAAARAAVAAALELESEPLTADLQQQAYSEMLLRERVNDACRATFLALAAGADLDHIGASRGLTRKTVQKADPAARPPVPEIKESDAEFRRRIQMHPEKFAVAGPYAAYRAHALDVEGVADANPFRPMAGTVRVYIKSYDGQGIPTRNLLDKVAAHLSDEERRPLCDTVEVAAGRPKDITIEYETTYEGGPDKRLVAAAQREELDAVISANIGLAGELALSKIIGALDTPGVKKVRLIRPDTDISCAAGEFIRVTSITAREAV